MGEIHKISEKLGQLTAMVENIEKTGLRTEEKIDNHTKDIVELEQRTKSAHKRLDAHNTHIEDYKTMKQRGFGIVSVIGAIAGVLTTLGFKVFDKILG